MRADPALHCRYAFDHPCDSASRDSSCAIKTLQKNVRHSTHPLPSVRRETKSRDAGLVSYLLRPVSFNELSNALGSYTARWSALAVDLDAGVLEPVQMSN